MRMIAAKTVIFFGFLNEKEESFLGDCIDGKCDCKNGFFGADCSEKACEMNCNYKGLCKNGTCFCAKGWTGKACNIKLCPNFCNNKYIYCF